MTTCVLDRFIAESTKTMKAHECPTILDSRKVTSTGCGSLLTYVDIEENPGP